MSDGERPYPTYRIQRSAREPLVSFMKEGLEASGCQIISASDPDRAPFQISAVAPWGERIGFVAYAFLANSKPTRNRPPDEWRFQIKYGSDDRAYHSVWQDPYGLYTTLLLGINPEAGFFVAADPVLNDPTRFFISKEFKQQHVDEIRRTGWYSWERDFTRPQMLRDSVEVLVGGTVDRFLDLVRFEREVLGEEQGNRQLVAEQLGKGRFQPVTALVGPSGEVKLPKRRLHRLEKEFELEPQEILTLIAQAPRLKTAVRGWVAEEHLLRKVRTIGTTECRRIEEDGKPDLGVVYRGRPEVLIECKNVLRGVDKGGLAVVDFQRTRAAKSDPCSRYYRASDFNLVAACLHARSERWEFRMRPTAGIPPHKECPNRLHHRLTVGDDWSADLEAVIDRVTG